MDKFVIAGVQRTGTTMTVRTMNQHENLVCYGEMFVNKYPNKTPGSYEHWYRENRFRKIEKILSRKRSVYNYLDEIYSAPEALIENDKAEKREIIKATGFKLMYRQAVNNRSILQYITEKQVPVLLLVRKNILRVLVSRSVNRSFDIAHTNKKIQTPRVELDTERLLFLLKRLKDINMKWESLLSRNNYIKVTYEDFVSDRAKQLNRITDFLKVPSNPNLAPPTVKLNPDKLEDIILNYEDVKKTLDSTEFAHLMSE